MDGAGGGTEGHCPIPAVAPRGSHFCVGLRHVNEAALDKWARFARRERLTFANIVL